MAPSKRLFLVIGTLCGALGCTAKAPPVPPGAARVFFDHCSVLLPRGAAFSTPRDQIDSAAHIISDADFSAMLQVEDFASVPLEGTVANYKLTKPKVAGVDAQEVSGVVATDERNLTQRRYLSVPVGSSGKYLNVQYGCRDGGCASYQALVDSIAFTE